MFHSCTSFHGQCKFGGEISIGLDHLEHQTYINHNYFAPQYVFVYVNCIVVSVHIKKTGTIELTLYSSFTNQCLNSETVILLMFLSRNLLCNVD